MTLIELTIYIGFLSIILCGCVFSTYSIILVQESGWAQDARIVIGTSTSH